MSRPRLLDLFCGAGGASMGYHRAGFEVVGVDIKPQPRYPFSFIQGDALEVLQKVLSGVDKPDAIAASPPCQRYSAAASIHGNAEDHPDLVEPVRTILQAIGKPYIMENVPGAPMLSTAVTVCGLALDCGVKRHRLFESNKMLFGTTCPRGHQGDWVTVFGHTCISRQHRVPAQPGKRLQSYKHLGVERARSAMGIDWMTRDELSQAIPPAYTEYLGRQLLTFVEAASNV